MFNSIICKNAISSNELIDIGTLVECLIFYKKVIIVGHYTTLEHLLKHIPPFYLLSLLKDKRLEFHYFSDLAVVVTNKTSSGRSLHKLTTCSIPDFAYDKIAASEFIKKAGDSAQVKKAARQFSDLIQPLGHENFNQESLNHTFSKSTIPSLYIQMLIRKMMPTFQLPPNFYLKIEQETNGLLIDTNLDFDRLNKSYHKVIPPSHSTISEEYILALLQGTYESTFIAATLNAEISTNSLESFLHMQVIENLDCNIYSKTQIERFVHLTFDNAHAIKDAVNSGAVSFSSIMKLLDSAEKFRHWLHDQPVKSDIIKAYYDEVTRISWVDKLPVKIVRWLLFTFTGSAIDTVSQTIVGGMALGMVDTFFLGKLLNGWRPNQFIDNVLKPAFI